MKIKSDSDKALNVLSFLFTGNMSKSHLNFHDLLNWSYAFLRVHNQLAKNLLRFFLSGKNSEIESKKII